MVRMKTILESAEFFSRKLELVKRMIRFKHCCVILPETYIFSDNSFRSPLPLSKLTVKKYSDTFLDLSNIMAVLSLISKNI